MSEIIRRGNRRRDAGDGLAPPAQQKIYGGIPVLYDAVAILMLPTGVRPASC